MNQTKVTPLIWKHGFWSVIKLGMWCDNQRQAKKPNGRGKLTEKQICRLNTIGFVWERSARVTQKKRSSIRL